MISDRKQYNRLFYEKNKEKRKEDYQQNRDKLLNKQREYHKNNKNIYLEYYKKNKDKYSEKSKIYNETNKEQLKKYRTEYYKRPKAIKVRRIIDWKKYGLKLYGYTYDELYEYYLSVDNCEVCNKDISMGGHYKHMDHCHDTGCFRWILCDKCNIQDNWMNII